MAKRQVKTELNIDSKKAERRLAWERSISHKRKKVAA